MMHRAIAMLRRDVLGEKMNPARPQLNISLGLGLGFWVLGFRLWVLGFGLWVLGFGFWVLGFWVLGCWFWVLSFGF